jgi:hypothetical protein
MYQEETTNLLGEFLLFVGTAERYSLHAWRAFFSTVHFCNTLGRFLDTRPPEERRALALRALPSPAGAGQGEKGAKAVTGEVAEE